MFAGHSWQEALAQSQLNVSRSTAYRLRQLARDDDKAELAFLDDRHGHPYKLIEPARTWLAEFCTTPPQAESSPAPADLNATLGVPASARHINRVLADRCIITPPRGQAQWDTRKNWTRLR